MREKAENELFSRQTALADLGRLLAMFFRLPTLKLTEGLSGGALQEDLQAIAGELEADQSSLAPLAEYRGAGGRQLLHELRQEYTRLFTHPENPALRCHEYLFLHGDGKEAPLLHINPAALSAREAYREAGFCPTGGHESADHISCELEFAACLLYQIAKAEKGRGRCCALAKKSRELPQNPSCPLGQRLLCSLRGKIGPALLQGRRCLGRSLLPGI